jgi:hypothetical protein
VGKDPDRVPKLLVPASGMEYRVETILLHLQWGNQNVCHLIYRLVKTITLEIGLRNTRKQDTSKAEVSLVYCRS